MEKVKVNQTVADWIEEIRKRCVAKNEKEFFSIMFGVVNTYYDELYKHIDIVTLAKAIQYGYEVEYEFKVGDIVVNDNGDLLRVVQDIEKETSNTRWLSYVNRSKHLFTLICKAENREDLKQKE